MPVVAPGLASIVADGSLLGAWLGSWAAGASDDAVEVATGTGMEQALSDTAAISKAADSQPLDVDVRVRVIVTMISPIGCVRRRTGEERIRPL